MRADVVRMPVIAGVVWAIILLCVLPAERSFADDAVVLPKGFFRLLNETQFFLPITQRYNKNGDKEDIAKDFNTTLNSVVFSDLRGLEVPNPAALGCGLAVPPPFCLQTGTAALGRSVVSFNYSIQQTMFQPAFGLTDRLSIGANIPYFWQKNTVSASLDNTSATVGINPLAVSGANAFGFVPLNAPLPGTRRPTSEDAQRLLMSRGFKRLQTWEDDGFGDIEIGGKYQYFRSENFRAAFTGGARFPTGKVDDPDNLSDRGFGTGAYALLFRFHQDFISQPPGLAKRLGFPTPGSYFINTTFRYDLYLPDKQPLRVCDVHDPLCPFKDTVRRDIGDIFEAEISASYGLPLEGLFFTPLYKFTNKFRDHYAGNMNLNYGVLAEESNFYDHSYRVGFSYSTVPLVVQKKFPWPLAASVFYWDRFAANNNRYVAKSIGFNIAVFF
jgi:hypothetical protein